MLTSLEGAHARNKQVMEELRALRQEVISLDRQPLHKPQSNLVSQVVPRFRGTVAELVAHLKSIKQQSSPVAR